jgi:tetratricopeptide (TPR) repeat protein
MKGSQVAWFGAVGDEDFNYREMRAIEELLSEQGNRHRLEVFEGPHRWMPEPLARLAVGWMELAAMRSGRRAVDGAVVDRLYAGEMAAAADLEAADRDLEAMRRFQAVARLFEGLRDVEEAEEAAARLAGSAAVERALAEEKRWNAFEGRYERTLERTLVEIGGSGQPPPLEEVTRELMIGDLETRVRRGGWEGATAGRILNRLRSVFGFYMARDMLAKGRYDQAAVALGVALAIDDRDPVARYNLACALARSGQPDAALDSLERAVELGFRDLEHIEADPDLESLRGAERYQELIASLRTTGAP